MVYFKDLVQYIVNVAEKGANIARVIRKEEDLLHLLVEEKTGNQKNKRFVQDFKTLADVLVQEIVRHDLSEKIPGIKGSIYGEESNKFTNALGESVIVEIQKTENETLNLLSNILDENVKAASLLAKAVHEQVHVNISEDLSSLESSEIDAANVGVWIDPIDSTACYIDGDTGEESALGIVSTGLQCVAVLIGAYDKSSGLPFFGVINQPFCHLDSNTNKWTGRYVWGLSFEDIKLTSVSQQVVSSSSDEKPVILMSKSERPAIQEMYSNDCKINYASGAGYKLLCVILGLVDAYVISKSTTFKWDVCGPHAILLSMGGGVIHSKYIKELYKDGNNWDDLLGCQVVYDQKGNENEKGIDKWCNQGGFIAYRSKDVLSALININCTKNKITPV